MLNQLAAKIVNQEGAKTKVLQWQSAGDQIVFTNGCFDLLHYGHIYYLAQARELGDRLVVGLNSSTSVSRLKGPHRPINDEQTRKYQLAAMSCIDLVIVFEEDTPLTLIQHLQPDVLVKGGDWKPEQIVGADVVLKRGGTVKSLAFVEGYSSTSIEQKIIKSHNK